jgi:tripartite-type tricarboxylate transporter receptor subunit TctC
MMSSSLLQTIRRIAMRTVKLLAAIVISVVLALSAAQAAPPTYPDKPIRLVIGSAPGSGPDIISRALAERLYGAWGQRVVVDARPGVAGILSAELVLRTPPDGYTWMMLTSQLLVATEVFPNVKFNLEKDFASISLIGTVPFVLVVNPEVPAKSIPELIELAKKTPLRYGSAGTGASEHLSGVLFTRLTGTDILHVPYKGIAEALTAAMGKEVHFTYGVLPAVLAMIQSGRVRALGVTSPKRDALLPDVPSISELVPGYQTLGWYSVVAPTGTPEAVLVKASAEAAKAVKDPQFAEQLKSLGITLVGSTRAELDAFRQAQRKQISEIVKVAGVDVK